MAPVFARLARPGASACRHGHARQGAREARPESGARLCAECAGYATFLLGWPVRGGVYHAIRSRKFRVDARGVPGSSAASGGLAGGGRWTPAHMERMLSWVSTG